MYDRKNSYGQCTTENNWRNIGDNAELSLVMEQIYKQEEDEELTDYEN